MACYAYWYQQWPAFFQLVMDNILQGLDCADVYIDDIIIGSSGETEEELLANHDRNVPCWIG